MLETLMSEAPTDTALPWSADEMALKQAQLFYAKRAFDGLPADWNTPSLVQRHDGELSAYPLHHGITLGRGEEAALKLDDPAVSSLHLCFETQEDLWLVRDLKSRNGLWINGRKHTAKILAHGDMIRLGSIDLFFFAGE